MKLTPSIIAANAEVIAAAIDGNPVELLCSTPNPEWRTYQRTVAGLIEDLSRGWKFRVPPAPKTRPCNCPDDVPLNCWLDISKIGAAMAGPQSHLITGISASGVFSAGAWKTWDDLRKDEYQYSTDRKTWLPCEVDCE